MNIDESAFHLSSKYLWKFADVLMPFAAKVFMNCTNLFFALLSPHTSHSIKGE